MRACCASLEHCANGVVEWCKHLETLRVPDTLAFLVDVGCRRSYTAPGTVTLNKGKEYMYDEFEHWF